MAHLDGEPAPLGMGCDLEVAWVADCIPASDVALRIERDGGGWEHVVGVPWPGRLLRDLEPGTYSLGLEALAWSSPTLTVPLVAGQSPVRVELPIQPVNRVVGYAVDAATGERLPTFELTLEARELGKNELTGELVPMEFLPVSVPVASGEQATFCVGGWIVSPDADQLRVVGRAHGYSPEFGVWIDVDAAPAFEILDVVFAFERAARISGMVRDATGDPADEALVRWVPSQARAEPATVSGGRLEIPLLDPRQARDIVETERSGRYAIEVSRAGRGSVEVLGVRHPPLSIPDLDLLPGQDLHLDLVLTEAAVVHGTVRQGEDPMAGIFVLLESRAGGLVTAWDTVTDANGRFRLDGLPAGSHDLFVFREGGADEWVAVAEAALDLEVGAVRELDFDLQSAGGIPVYAHVLSTGDVWLEAALIDPATGLSVGDPGPVGSDGHVVLRAPGPGTLLVGAMGEALDQESGTLEVVMCLQAVDLGEGRSPPTLLLDATRGVLEILGGESPPAFWRVVPLLDQPDLSPALALRLTRLPSDVETLRISGLPPGRYRVERGSDDEGEEGERVSTEVVVGPSVVSIRGPGS